MSSFRPHLPARLAHDTGQFLRLRLALPEFAALTDDEFAALLDHPDVRRDDAAARLVALYRALILGTTLLALPFLLLLARRAYPGASIFVLLLALAPIPPLIIAPTVIITRRRAFTAAHDAIRTRFIPTNCARCRYSILGLPHIDRAIACPECTHQTRILGRAPATARAVPPTHH